ncbi:GerAB/ArcD/ProY family transporter [Metabacillus idriensis]|uniref:GerAB/ArcD/ProY family transporter n=1 Tax=Metabacillus idriensis TaxID=324768 RepID=UPI003D2954F2
MNIKVKEQFQVSTFFTFFLIHASQTGIGILSFQSQISKDAQQDAWISLIISGITIHIILFIIFKLLDDNNNDLVAVNLHCFGKIIGNLLSILALVYFWLATLTVFRTYIEVIQVWVYPTIKTWQLCIIFGITLYYLVSSGFRILAGFSFWGVVIPSFLFVLIYFPIKHMNPIYLQPVFSHSFGELLLSAKASTFLFLGFEWILMYYPFIKNPKGISKWAHLGTLYTLIVYLIITFVSFLYFNQEVIQQLPWATLMMVKIVQFSFMERFEYVFIFIWVFVIIPPMCISLWACTRIAKRTFSVPPKVSLVLFLFILIITAVSLKEFKSIEKLSNFTSDVGFGFIYVYIPFLFIVKTIIESFIKNRER